MVVSPPFLVSVLVQIFTEFPFLSGSVLQTVVVFSITVQFFGVALSQVVLSPCTDTESSRFEQAVQRVNASTAREMIFNMDSLHCWV